MSSRFRIEGPAVISFSGGRTSAYMLRRILDEGLRQDVHVLFANTGKEREETLDFVRDVQERWCVRVHWIEYRRVVGTAPAFAEVSFETASRRGEPFSELIQERQFLPNPVIRFCTQELKIRPMKNWMLGLGYEHWTNVVGIRADEPRRVAKMRNADIRERWDVALPLADAGIGVRDVAAFWAGQPFDLQLQPWEGNCDLCFMKGADKRARIMLDRPDLAEWWTEQERRIGAYFRKGSRGYAAMLDSAKRQLELFESDGGDLGDCICHEGTAEAA